MKYLALLRAVNVGGKGMIKMAELKIAFQNDDFTNVMTYINSGNILFESDKKNIEQLTDEIELILRKSFFEINTVVLSYHDLKDILINIPHSWKKDDVRKYIGFMKSPAKPDDVIQEAQLKEDVDSIAKGPNVVYMTTKMSGLTKSGFLKLISKPIYKNITIRNYNTAQKLLKLMEQS